MRPHGRASIDPRRPRALAICDRCGAMVNHDTLKWQMRWRGPRPQNIRLLVCSGCLDDLNEQERTIVLPTDPVTIGNARPQDYALADNPASPLGYDPRGRLYQVSTGLGTTIGNLTGFGGLDAAFDGVTNKPFGRCAAVRQSVPGFNNYVGKNWAADSTGMLATLPSTVPALTHVVSSFSLYAPSDMAFRHVSSPPAAGIEFHLEGSANGVTWTTLHAGVAVGVPGEIVTVTTTSAQPYQYHRAVIDGHGFEEIGLAQVVLNISDAGPNEI
jgi:hypothetical protein